MSEFEVGVRAYTHTTVEADSREEARRKAMKEASPSRGWTVEGADVTEL